MARFTVLGASGFVGGHLVEHLHRKGHEVWVPGRDDPEIFQRDLGYAVYCIGVIRDRWQRPFDSAEAHVCKLAQVLGRCRFSRLVYLSTSRLYEGIEGVADETTELRFDPLNPAHLYTLSKAFGETLAFHTGKPATVVRLANVYDDRLSRTDFLCETVRRARGGGLVEVDAEPTNGRDYIHMDDVCSALERISLEGRRTLYNLATGAVFCNQRLAELCQREFGCRLVFRRGPAQKLPPKISIERLAGDFGIRPPLADERLVEVVRRLARGHNAA